MNPPDPITRLNAALEGRYRIESELGEGGMATVYLADDLKHERRVALKVLKPELAAVVGAERFLAEIKTTANLSHPHILPLHDSGEADGFLFYVMPHVDGETLRDKLDREHQLPVDDAVRIATNVAEALDYAHRQGVIHRDIKPANILLQDGKPVVSDFGIAIAVGTAGQGRLTETGLSVGTPHYMSPEQATGDMSVGAATDTYALGAVLYEMLVGEPPYTGSTAQAILGKIIAGKLASATEGRASVPSHVDAAIRKALEKVPADRFTGAQEFAKALADPGFSHGGEATTAASIGGLKWNRTSRPMTAVMAALVIALGWSLSRTPQSLDPGVPTRVVMGDLDVPPAGLQLAISTDGRRFVVGRREDGGERVLYIREAADLDWVRVPNTEGAAQPSFSPDGQWILFNDGSGAVRRVSIEGGPALPVVSGGNAHWGAGDVIVYRGGDDGADLYRIDASGGEPVALFDSDTIDVRAPYLLPNGKGVVFSTRTNGDPLTGRILVLDIENDQLRELVASGNQPRYVSTGHLIYGHGDGALMAVPFDLEALAVTGSPIPVLSDLAVSPGGASQFAISETGTLLYQRRRVGGLVTPVWVERDGVAREIDPGWPSHVGDPDNSSVTLSPLGDRLAISIPEAAGSAGPSDLWVKTLDAGPLSRLTFEGARNRRALWSADGRFLTFVSNRSGRHALWTKPADGSRPAELVREAEGEAQIEGFSASSDGAWLVLREGLGPGDDILALQPGTGGEPLPVAASEYSERAPTLSPDGNWLAYTSNESGRDEIHVRPFPDAASGRWQVSPDGGTEPVWARSGQELFYRNQANELVAAQVPEAPSSAWNSDDREVLFSVAAYQHGNRHPMYDVSPDGQRFVMLRLNTSQTASSGVVLVVNWLTELRARMGDN